MNKLFPDCEREVISIPAGDSYPFVKKHSIYSCPDSGKWATYKPARYMAFRGSGGTMEMLYGLDDILLLNPHRPNWKSVPAEFMPRLRQYIEQWSFSNEPVFKFYILSLTDQIPLPHKPYVAGKPQGHVYLRQIDVESGIPEVRVASHYERDEFFKRTTVAPPTVRALVAEREASTEETLQKNQSSKHVKEFGSWEYPAYLDPTRSEFDQEKAKRDKGRVAATIVRRRGQQEFREELLKIYAFKCAVTGYNIPACLEAAHIMSYYGIQSNHPANGILLRTDIHTLFDLGLLTVDSEEMVVILSPTMQDSTYKYLHGKPLSLPDNPSVRPSKVALEAHRRATGL